MKAKKTKRKPTPSWMTFCNSRDNMFEQYDGRYQQRLLEWTASSDSDSKIGEGSRDDGHLKRARNVFPLGCLSRRHTNTPDTVQPVIDYNERGGVS